MSLPEVGRGIGPQVRHVKLEGTARPCAPPRIRSLWAGFPSRSKILVTNAPLAPVSTAKPVALRNGRGLALMALGMFLFSAVDTQAKFLTETLHPVQIVWIRQLGLLVAAFVLIALKGPQLLATKNPGMQIARGACAAASATIFIFAVSYIPLADAVAISFVAPFIVTLMAAFLLREPVGMRRWIAVAAGFVGTLVVIRPGFGVMHPAALLVIFAAALFSIRQIISRALAHNDRTATTIAYTAFVGSAVLTIPLPFIWRWPETGLEVALCVSIAVLAAAAEFCVIKSLEMALAVVVAPVQYSLIIWGTIYGYLVFGQFPDSWTWVGTAIIIGTGLYTIHREQLARRRAASGQNGEIS